MKTLLATLAVVTLIASPLFAQSFDPDNGTGNVLAFSRKPAPQRNGALTLRQQGADAFASVSRFRPSSGDPTLTEGGSTGYNENLRNF